MILSKSSLINFLLLVYISIIYLPSGSFAAENNEDSIGTVVSVQGNVQVQRMNDTRWASVHLNDALYNGDKIETQRNSRAGVELHNGPDMRIDQESEVTISKEREKESFFINLFKGFINFFSRHPRSLEYGTPFVNGSVEGTEFCVNVEEDHTLLSVFKGRVAATNEAGSLILTSGQSAIAQAGQAPQLRIVVAPRDAVHWALYYPAILDYKPADFQRIEGKNWQEVVRKSIEFYRAGDLSMSLSSLDKAPEDVSDPRFFSYRAGLLLTVGRVDEASDDIETALKLDPSNSHAFALQSIVAMVQNRKDQSMELAEKAVALDPKSSVARVALSYSQQAHFDLEGALKSLVEAVNLDPENALALARLAEVWLSLGYLDKALEVAQKAVALNSNLARTQTVLGFAYLTQIKTKDSMSTFEKAIALDSAAPLPRLGLGLAKIRDGELEEGRQEIEIAAALDPNNSLIRSYLGKAYFEEKRMPLDEEQYEIAKELDPLDPTPWFYDAIRKQTLNRPVEALHDLQNSIELNDNRAIYRSRLLLDDDLAARSVSLGRIYQDLGFEQLALVEGWKSLNTDPSNYSTHRFLSDSYSALPRHEIARVSELLQSQLLQPININPVQPSLAESNLYILEGAGPSDPSFNEFSPLFNRNRLALQAAGVAGSNSTWGSEIVQSGVWNKFSYSVGGFTYSTDGFRENNYLEQDIFNTFIQASLTHKTSIQAEHRYIDTEKGDLPLRFDPDNFSTSLIKEEERRSTRFGFHHAFTPRSDIIASVIFGRGDFDVAVPPMLDVKMEDDGYMAEVQHLFRSERFHLTSGVGHYNADRKQVSTVTIVIPPFPPMTSTTIEESDIDHSDLYVYTQLNRPDNFTWTIGASADLLESGIVDRDQLNPKLGLTWNVLPNTTARAAVFRALTRTLVSSQTLEPTQVAGFNQFFDDPEGTESWRYGIGVDQKFYSDLYAGLELSQRDLEVPFVHAATLQIREADWDERLDRAYLYWTLQPWLALSAEYQFERFERVPEATGEAGILEVDTHCIPLGISIFHSLGFSARLKASYVDQEGEFEDALGVIVPGDDQFWTVDAFVEYRLPKRWGLITVEARNLFDKSFDFQDMDVANPSVYPERLILGRFILAF